MAGKKIIIITGLLIAISIPLTLSLIKQKTSINSRASAPDKLEAESGNLNSNAQRIDGDSTASGGSFVRLNTASTLSPTPISNPTTGTGSSYKPEFVAVTGGGAMPSTTGGINVQNYGAKGDGITDDTTSFKNAANAAATAGKPLLIPKTNAFYKIVGTITIKSSVIGTGGMPTIKQTNGDHGWGGTLFYVDNNVSGWIYNLHLVGDYAGQYFNYRDKTYPNGEGARNIRLGGVNGLTIKGNLLEDPWGDGVNDGSSSTAYPARNVLIENNTFKNAMRCAIALTTRSDQWAIMNNKIIHSSSYVNTIDAEPNAEQVVGEHLITNIEIAHNEYQVTSPYEVNMFTGWFDPTPGGNIWVHNNYGSWVGPFTKFVGLKGAPSTWTNVNVSNNIKTP